MGADSVVFVLFLFCLFVSFCFASFFSSVRFHPLTEFCFVVFCRRFFFVVALSLTRRSIYLFLYLSLGVCVCERRNTQTKWRLVITAAIVVCFIAFDWLPWMAIGDRFRSNSTSFFNCFFFLKLSSEPKKNKKQHREFLGAEFFSGRRKMSIPVSKILIGPRHFWRLDRRSIE